MEDFSSYYSNKDRQDKQTVRSLVSTLGHLQLHNATLQSIRMQYYKSTEHFEFRLPDALKVIALGKAYEILPAKKEDELIDKAVSYELNFGNFDTNGNRFSEKYNLIRFLHIADAYGSRISSQTQSHLFGKASLAASCLDKPQDRFSAHALVLKKSLATKTTNPVQDLFSLNLYLNSYESAIRYGQLKPFNPKLYPLGDTERNELIEIMNEQPGKIISLLPKGSDLQEQAAHKILDLSRHDKRFDQARHKIAAVINFFDPEMPAYQYAMQNYQDRSGFIPMALETMKIVKENAEDLYGRSRYFIKKTWKKAKQTFNF